MVVGRGPISGYFCHVILVGPALVRFWDITPGAAPCRGPFHCISLLRYHYSIPCGDAPSLSLQALPDYRIPTALAASTITVPFAVLTLIIQVGILSRNNYIFCSDAALSSRSSHRSHGAPSALGRFRVSPEGHRDRPSRGLYEAAQRRPCQMAGSFFSGTSSLHLPTTHSFSKVVQIQWGKQCRAMYRNFYHRLVSGAHSDPSVGVLRYNSILPRNRIRTSSLFCTK